MIHRQKIQKHMVTLSNAYAYCYKRRSIFRGEDTERQWFIAHHQLERSQFFHSRKSDLEHMVSSHAKHDRLKMAVLN